MPKVLVIQDIRSCAGSIVNALRRSGFETVWVGSANFVDSALAEGAYDAVIIDPTFGIGDSAETPDGIQLYDGMRERIGDVPVLMVCNVSYLRDGMQDEMQVRGLPFVDIRDFNPDAQLR